MLKRSCGFSQYVAISVVLGALTSCSWFPESTLILSPESRLPRWIELHGVARDDVTVRVDFIVPLWGAYARISVIDRHGKVLERVDAVESSAAGVQTAEGAPSRGGFPVYQVAAFNGAKISLNNGKPTTHCICCLLYTSPSPRD